MNSVSCQIYASRRRDQMYLYVAQERGLDAVPETLLRQLGALREVMTLEITPQRALARADTLAVLTSLREEGYYLQMPPSATDFLQQRPR